MVRWVGVAELVVVEGDWRQQFLIKQQQHSHVNPFICWLSMTSVPLKTPLL